MQPFMDAARTKAALVGGGLQNLSGGVNQAIGGLMGAQMMQGGYGIPQQKTPYNPFTMQQQNSLFSQLASIYG